MLPSMRGIRHLGRAVGGLWLLAAVVAHAQEAPLPPLPSGEPPLELELHPSPSAPSPEPQHSPPPKVGATSAPTATRHLQRTPAKEHVKVRVEADTDGAILQSRVSLAGRFSASWHTVCHTPCTVNAERGSFYRIAGRGITPSEPFVMDARRPVLLKARTASTMSRGLGLSAVIAGGSAALFGWFRLVGAAQFDHEEDRPQAEDQRKEGTYLIGGGLVVGIAGLLLTLYNIKTDITYAPYPVAGQSSGGRLVLSF